jgi:hypothetical protein
MQIFFLQVLQVQKRGAKKNKKKIEMELDNMPDHDKGIVFVSYYFSEKSSEPSAEVVEIFFNSRTAYFYSTGKYYSGKVKRSAVGEFLSIHFSKWNKKTISLDGKPDIDVTFNIFDNGKLDESYHRQGVKDRLFPCSNAGYVKKGYYRVYGGMVEVHGKPVKESIEHKIAIYSRIADKKMAMLSPDIARAIWGKRFDVSGIGRERSQNSLDSHNNHKIYESIVGVYEAFTANLDEPNKITKWIVKFRRDLVAHAKPGSLMEYKGSVSVRKRKTLHLQLSSAKDWYERASFPTGNKGIVELEEDNGRHYFLSFDEDGIIIKGTFNALDNYSQKLGKCIMFKKNNDCKEASARYNDAKAENYNSKEEITQLFNFNSTLAEFFKNDINID